MPSSASHVGPRLEQVRARIAQACRRAHRDPASVTLIAVTKGVPSEAIQEVVRLGATDLGENRVQEALAKQESLGRQAGNVRWHLIGQLQRNKAKHVVGRFALVHSVDNVELVQALETQAAKRGADSQDVLIQVNVSGEATKGGCRPRDVEPLIQTSMTALHLRLAGFMTLAPYSDDPEAARPVFRQLRELRDRIQAGMTHRLQLSMGMSGDFEAAIEEGADWVRIGTAIFGTQG